MSRLWRCALLMWVACGMLVSCSPCARLARRCPPVTVAVRDSVHVHDTVIREVVRIDTVQVVQLLHEVVSAVVLATDTAKAETAYARAMAWLSGDKVSLLISNRDSAAVLVKRVRELEQRLSERVEYKEVERVQRVPYVPFAVKILAWAGGVLVLYEVGKIVLRVVVRYMRV